MKSLTSPVFVALVLIHAEGRAHHSASIYDQEVQVSIEGTIVRYEWRNPHVYLWVEEETDSGEGVTWEIEGQPPSILRRLGWTEDAVNVGDRVTVKANPRRNPDIKSALMTSLEKADATVLSMEFGHIVTSLAQDDVAITERATSLTGTWITLFRMEVLIQFVNPSTLALTEKGRAALESFVEEVENPGIECVPSSSPNLMLVPDSKSIEVRDDIVLIRGEIDAIERRVYLHLDSHGDATDSIQGHSIGRWAGDALLIDTRHFTPHRSGNGSGLPSGPGKHLVERLELNEEGTHLTYSFELEDPEYLTQPVTGEVQWSYRPDLEYVALPCDLDNARRFAE
jgi:hypothetical protein